MHQAGQMHESVGGGCAGCKGITKWCSTVSGTLMNGGKSLEFFNVGDLLPLN
jgi:hypothetical protein